MLQRTTVGVVLEGFSENQILSAIDQCRDRSRMENWKSRAAELGQNKYNWSVSARNLLQAYGQLVVGEGEKEVSR